MESKESRHLRKHTGYGHIPSQHADTMNRFYMVHMNVYLNYHWPCGFAEITEDASNVVVNDREVEPGGTAGTIGLDVLIGHVVVLDFPAKRPQRGVELGASGPGGVCGERHRGGARMMQSPRPPTHNMMVLPGRKGPTAAMVG